MKISSKGEYALRILIVLGQHEGNLQTIGEISDQTLVTVKYIEQIMIQLRKHGYVQSKRGIKGGYLLKVSPQHINIGEVVRQLEGPLSPMSCASVTKYEPCELEKHCLLKPLWTLVRDTIAYVLEQTTLDDLLKGNIQKMNGGYRHVQSKG